MKRFFVLLLTAACLSFADVSAQNAAADYDVSGVVTTVAGTPVEGVAVSDGYSVVITDKLGEYRIKRHPEAFYVFYSVPAEYEIPLRQGAPCFYKKLTDAKRYDFVVKPMKKGAEKNFTLFCIADPQCQTIQHVHRLRTETIPDVRASAAKRKTSCYAVSLGDIAYSQGPRNATYLLPIIKEEMSAANLGMPIFQTMGNHDNEHEAIALNDHNTTPMVRYQRTFESVFGPVNYSWNRGNAHIVSMNDVMYTSLESSGKYHGDFSDAQVEWLRQDLQFVPKDKLLILCLHIPLAGILKYDNVQKVLAMIREFEHCHIMAGHTHYNRNHIHPNGVYEHVHAAVCGAWWISRLNGDGTPYGYGVYDIEGATMRDWRYRGTGLDPDFQLRVYRGDALFGGEYETFAMPFGRGVILANVWNADPDWRIEVFEDGRLSGVMKSVKTTTGVEKPSVKSSKDWWAVGYHIGVVGRGHRGGHSALAGGSRKSYMTTCRHMYVYELKNPDAEVEVVATDRFGNRFRQTHVISGSEYEGAASPF